MGNQFDYNQTTEKYHIMKKNYIKLSRKTRYTRMVLLESLIELMNDKPIYKITIMDICRLADVSRSTFYAHYNDQYDLLNQIQEEVYTFFRELVEKYYDMEHNDFFAKLTEEYLHYIANNKKIMKVLLSDNGDINFRRKLHSISRPKNTWSHIIQKSKDEAKAQEYAETFYRAGSLSLVKLWLKNDLDMPVSDLTKLIVKLTGSIMK